MSRAMVVSSIVANAAVLAVGASTVTATATVVAAFSRNASNAAVVISNRFGRNTFKAFKLRHRQHRHVGQVADALVHVHVVAGHGHQQARCRRASAPSRWRPCRGSSAARTSSSSISVISSSAIREATAIRVASAAPSSAAGTTSRGAAWRGCVRRRGECRCGASRPGRCPCPSADTSSSSCRPLPRGSSSSTVPCRRLVWYMTTASCSNCLLMRGANSAGSISYLPTSAAGAIVDRQAGHGCSFLIFRSSSLTLCVRYNLFVCLNHHVAAVGPRHGAADQQQVVLHVDADDLEIADRAAGAP